MTLKIIALGTSLGVDAQFADAAAPDKPVPKSTAEVKRAVKRILRDRHFRGGAVFRNGEVHWQGDLRMADLAAGHRGHPVPHRFDL